MQAKAARTHQIVEVLGSLGTTAYARLDRCSKVAEEWAAESMAGVAMRRSRRASACRRGSTPSGCRNGSAQRRNFWTPSASCFPARSRADPKVWRVAMPLGSRRTGGPCLPRTCRDLYSRSRCRSRPNLGNVLDWEHLPALYETLRPRPACRNRQLGLAGRAHESSGTANGYGAAGRPGERAVLRTHPCGQRCRSRNLDFAGGARTAADGSLVL